MQKIRYSNTERIGVNATESIFLNDFDWIFRVQDTVDVGIDAFVEQAINGDPKGKFIALQIKSGKGNFHVSNNQLTYYISNVHYNYWMNFDIPVIMIAHLPKKKKTYWQEISKEKIQKVKRSWKLIIPFENLLNEEAKPHLTKLLSSKNKDYESIKIFKGERLDERSLYHIAEKTKCISDASSSTSRTISMLEEMNIKTQECNRKITYFNQIGQSLRTPEAEAVTWRFSKDIMILSKRMDNENQIFAETFTEGLFGFQQVIKIHHNLANDESELSSSKESLTNIPNSLDLAINGLSILRKSINSLPNAFSSLKEAKYIMIEVLDNSISDYKEAKNMVIDLLNSI